MLILNRFCHSRNRVQTQAETSLNILLIYTIKPLTVSLDVQTSIIPDDSIHTCIYKDLKHLITFPHECNLYITSTRNYDFIKCGQNCGQISSDVYQYMCFHHSPSFNKSNQVTLNLTVHWATLINKTVWNQKLWYKLTLKIVLYFCRWPPTRSRSEVHIIVKDVKHL